MPSIGFIFDLDGTLVDSEHQIFSALNSVRRYRGHPELGFKECRSLIGLPASELFKDLCLDKNQLEYLIIEFREQLRRDILVKNNLFPGVLELLKVAERKSVMFGIATNKPIELATEVVKNSELSNFIFHISGTGTLKAKPSPEMLLNSAQEMKTSSNFMFGDRREDMQAAVRANFIPIGIAQTIHTADDLKSSGAELVFSSFHHALLNIDALMNRGA